MGTFSGIANRFGGILPYIRQSGTGKNAAVAIREGSAALAASAELSAMQKCQFGELLPYFRLPFWRE